MLSLTPALLFVLPALAQDTGVSSHAPLHSPDTTFYVELSSLAELPQAYRTTWIASLLNDEELAKAVEGLSQGEVKMSEMVAMLESYLDPRSMPPQMVELGMDVLLDNLESISASISLPADPAKLLELRHASNAQLEISALQTQLEFHAMNSGGEYPESLSALEDIGADLLSDPWGHDYQIDASGEVYSFGADGADGGSGLAADVRLGQSVDIQAMLLPVLAEELGLQVTLRCKSAEGARELLEMAASRQALEISEAIQVDGAPMLAATQAITEGEVTLHTFLAQYGNDVTLGFGNNRIEHLQARLSGRDRSQERRLHLADHADLAVALEALPDPGALPVLQTWRTMSWSELAQIGLELAVASGELDFDEMPVEVDVEELLGYFEAPDNGWRGEYTRTQMRADGRFLKESFGVGERAPAWRGADPKPSDLLSYLPDTSSLVWRTGLSGEGAAEAVLGLLEMVASEVDMPSPEALEQQLGFSLSEDLFGLLGDELVMSMDPVRGMGVPGMRAFIRVNEPELFAERLTALVYAVSDASGGLLSVKDRPYRKMPYVAISIQDQGFVQPAFGIVNGLLVVGAKGIGVKRELKRLRDLELHDLPFLEELSQHPNLLYVDWPALVGGAYGTVKAFAGLAAGFAGEDIPFDLSMLPDTEVLTRHFEATLSTTSFSEAGRITRAESSFGPEVLALVVGGSAALGIAVESDMGLNPEVEGELLLNDPQSPESETSLTFQAVRVGLEAYRYDRGGAYPAKLDDLLETNDQFPKGYLSEGTELIDGWGRALVYEPADDGSDYKLRSTGADGVDNAGGADDLVLQ